MLFLGLYKSFIGVLYEGLDGTDLIFLLELPSPRGFRISGSACGVAMFRVAGALEG